MILTLTKRKLEIILNKQLLAVALSAVFVTACGGSDPGPVSGGQTGVAGEANSSESGSGTNGVLAEDAAENTNTSEAVVEDAVESTDTIEVVVVDPAETTDTSESGLCRGEQALRWRH